MEALSLHVLRSAMGLRKLRSEKLRHPRAACQVACGIRYNISHARVTAAGPGVCVCVCDPYRVLVRVIWKLML